MSGMTVFYNEFYDRLEQLDSSGRFEAVLSRNTSGDNKIAAKGAILIRIIKFVLKIDTDTKDNQMMLFMLGKSHSQKAIRPWQYSIFVQTLLYTISSRLGVDATNDVMESWVNLFAFVMKSMLPPAIRGQVVETELSINTSSEVKEVRKKMKKGGKSAGQQSSTSDQESIYSERNLTIRSRNERGAGGETAAKYNTLQEVPHEE